MTDNAKAILERLDHQINDILYDLVAENEDLEEQIEKNKGEWIPISERLPKIADVYRVTRYYPNNVMNPKYLVDACAFDGSDTWYNDNRINHERAYADNVIAWQENPEPYKPEKTETCKGCLEPCIMYEPDMRGCKKKVTERGEE
jgi:hypothetical protein